MTGGSRSVPPASDQYSPPPFFPILLNNQLPARNIPSFFNNTIITKTSHPPNMKLKTISEPIDQLSNIRFEFLPIMSSILKILELLLILQLLQISLPVRSLQKKILKLVTNRCRVHCHSTQNTRKSLYQIKQINNILPNLCSVALTFFIMFFLWMDERMRESNH